MMGLTVDLGVNGPRPATGAEFGVSHMESMAIVAETAVEFGEALSLAGGAASSIYSDDMSMTRLFEIMGRNNIHFVYKAPTK